jgi:flagellum-specific peptidoglycan hydrolase FlgJ
MKHLIIYSIIFLWLIALTVAVRNKDAPPDIKEVIIVHEKYDDFFRDREATGVNMLVACEYYGIKHPSIVTAQAILESGNFKSEVFKKYNNPFGLYNSKAKDYYKFNHFSEAILAYQQLIESKYKEGEDYYHFLDRIGYAEDPNYIKKIKTIEKTIIPP